MDTLRSGETPGLFTRSSHSTHSLNGGYAAMRWRFKSGGWCGHRGGGLDRDQCPERDMPSPPTIVAVVPDDPQPELLAVGSVTAVQDDLLKQCEKDLHGGVAADCTAGDHRTAHVASVRSLRRTPGSATGRISLVDVKEATGAPSSLDAGPVQDIDGQARLDPRVEGKASEPTTPKSSYTSGIRSASDGSTDSYSTPAKLSSRASKIT